MLTFNLKKEWFEKIKSGEKTHEYREIKPFWTKRLVNYFDLFEEDIRTILTGKLYLEHQLLIAFVLGYTNKKILARCISITSKFGKNTDLDIDKAVYDIEFELIGDKNEH